MLSWPSPNDPDMYPRSGWRLLSDVTWIVLSSLAFGIGGAFMKAADGFARVVPSVMALICFAVGAVLLTMAMRAETLTGAYTVGLGVEAVVSVGLGRWLYGEQLHRPQVIGVLLILGGVAAVRAG